MAILILMMRGIFTLASLASVVLFPWPLTALLALTASCVEPLIPLAVGLFMDTLYYVPQTGGWPLFTFYGAGATALAFFVRSRLGASIIRG